MREVDALRGRMDLLLALDALLATRSVSRAAERAHLSQPAMSRALARLRSAFGDPLLVRRGAGTLLTPRAESLREPVADLLRRTAELLLPQHFDPTSAQYVFRCVIPDVLAAVLGPRLLAKLATEAPGCRISLEPWPGRPGAPPDAVVTSEPAPFPGFLRTPLFEDRDILAVGRGGVSEEPPLDRAHVAVVPTGFSEDPVDNWLRTQGRSRRVVATVPHYLLALQLVATTELVAILPSRLICEAGAAIGVKPAELPIIQESDQIWLLFPHHLESDGASTWLRGAIISVASSLLPTDSARVPS